MQQPILSADLLVTILINDWDIWKVSPYKDVLFVFLSPCRTLGNNLRVFYAGWQILTYIYLAEYIYIGRI